MHERSHDHTTVETARWSSEKLHDCCQVNLNKSIVVYKSAVKPGYVHVY